MSDLCCHYFDQLRCKCVWLDLHVSITRGIRGYLRSAFSVCLMVLLPGSRPRWLLPAVFRFRSRGSAPEPLSWPVRCETHPAVQMLIPVRLIYILSLFSRLIIFWNRKPIQFRSFFQLAPTVDRAFIRFLKSTGRMYFYRCRVVFCYCTLYPVCIFIFQKRDRIQQQFFPISIISICRCCFYRFNKPFSRLFFNHTKTASKSDIDSAYIWNSPSITCSFTWVIWSNITTPPFTCH